MIGRLTGTVAEIRHDGLLIDVNGVGYEVAASSKAIAELGHTGERVKVYTHLHVRDDGMNLFGFASEADRDLFRVLLGASGVGPKVAMAVLSVFSAEALIRAVAAEDVDVLIQVPGVGRRGAQKMILDLKPKLADLEADVLGPSESSRVRDALEGLGYSASEIREVLPMLDRSESLSEQIRHALRELAR